MFLTADQAAELLHCHPETIRRMAARRELPCAKIGKRWIFDREQLIAHVRELSCSTSVKAAPITGADSVSAIVKFAALQGQTAGPTPKTSRRSFALVSGARSSSESVTTPGNRPSSDG
jgi:excisionase family DNA binding protein